MLDPAPVVCAKVSTRPATACRQTDRHLVTTPAHQWGEGEPQDNRKRCAKWVPRSSAAGPSGRTSTLAPEAFWMRCTVAPPWPSTRPVKLYRESCRQGRASGEVCKTDPAALVAPLPAAAAAAAACPVQALPVRSQQSCWAGGELQFTGLCSHAGQAPRLQKHGRPLGGAPAQVPTLPRAARYCAPR